MASHPYDFVIIGGGSAGSALADCKRYLGPDHELTQTVRQNLDAATQA